MTREELLRSSINVTADSTRRRPTPYDLLVRQSRKIGAFATKTHRLTRNILRPITDAATHPDRILFGVPQTAAPQVYHQTVDSLVEQSHQVLAQASTVILPNNLFPDTVVVDRTKVTIIRRQFFWTSDTLSIRIEDILNVSMSTGPFFASLVISSRVMNSTDHYEIDYFWRRDAKRIKLILQGYVIALHNKADISELSRDELIATLERLGDD